MQESFDAAVYAGERIKAVRALLGVSQTELAKSLDVAPSLISHIEKGRRIATTELIDKIASTTGNPRSFFDAVPADLPPLTLRFRKLTKARSVETARASQLIVETYRVVWKMMHSRAGFIPPGLPVTTKDELSRTDIEQLAQQTRELLGLDEVSPIRNVTRSLERVGIVVAPLVFTDDNEDTGDDREFETVGHFGASCWPGGTEPAVIGYFEGAGGDRQRFTLAHELGHLVLHSRRRFIADPEDEANQFAGAFLVPESRATEFVAADTTLRDFAHLKAAWGISIQALIMRCGQLGLIDPARRTSLFKQLSARGWRRNEPVHVQNESPVLFRKLVSALYGEGRNGFQRAAESLGLSAFTLATLAGHRGQGDDGSKPPRGSTRNESAEVHSLRQRRARPEPRPDRQAGAGGDG